MLSDRPRRQPAPAELQVTARPAHRSTLVAVAVWCLSAGTLAPSGPLAGGEARLAAQDPPAMPRVFLKHRSDRAQRFVRTELFFGTVTPGNPVTDEQFLAFLDSEVTPRFPDGLTMFKGHGRFTGKDGVVVKEDPFMVVILHPFDDFSAGDRKLEEIRRTYRLQFAQESVLRVDYQFSVRVRF